MVTYDSKRGIPRARYPVVQWVSDSSGNPQGYGYEVKDGCCLWLRATFEPLVGSLQPGVKCVLRVPGAGGERVRLRASHGLRLGAPCVDGFYMLMPGERYLFALDDVTPSLISTFDFLL